MRLILLGPPGSGKGTQAKLLSRRIGVEHISTGDLLRAAIALRTPVGERARPFVESGGLVPDDLVNDLIAERFRRADRPAKFVLDGYPRTVAQGRALDALLRELGQELDAVLLVTVPDDAIVQRLSGRRTCPKAGCGGTYHLVTTPPKVSGVCDICGTALVQRADDKEETVKARLKVYHHDTAELIPYYRARGLLRDVSGTGAIEQVYQRLIQAAEGSQ